MGWLAERAEERSHPQALWPEARTVSASAFPTPPPGTRWRRSPGPDRGNLSVYARHRDYHDVLKGRLKHLAQFIASRFGRGARCSSTPRR